MPRFAARDGLMLHYEDAGQGLPVLCLAGLTRNSGDFEFLLPHMSKVRTIRMDYRGRGQSDYAEDFMRYSIPQEAEDAIALLDHLGIERAAILGTSRGGLIAMTLAASHRDRLAGVLFNDIGPEIDGLGLGRIMDYLGREPQFDDLDSAAAGLKAVMEAGFPGVPLSRWHRQAELMWYEKPQGGLGLRYDARLRDAVIAQSATGPAPDLWPLFEAIGDLPVTALRGANSDLLSPSTLTEMARRLPHLRAATIPDRAHVPFLDEPAAVTAIQDFLETCQ